MSEKAGDVFLKLAAEWSAEVGKTPRGNALPRAADLRALACLMLATRRGLCFGPETMEIMEANRQAVVGWNVMSWADQLPWNLCMSFYRQPNPPASTAMALTDHLSHPDSSIRGWMMDIGWVIPHFAFE